MSPRSTLLLVTLLVAVPAAAFATPARPEPVKRIMPVLHLDGSGPAPASTGGPSVEAINLLYHGGPIQKTPKVYLVFWGWLGQDPSGEAPYLIDFFNGVGGSSWANIKTQYDGTGQGFITNPTGQLKGVWFDDSLLPPPLPDVYIGDEARKAATHFGGADPDANYIIATPHLSNSAEFGIVFCAWHSTEYDGVGRHIAYTNMPYVTDAETGLTSCGANFVNPGARGRLDGASIVAGHEYDEAVEDPQLNAWYDANGAEGADKCAWVRTGPGRLQNIVLPTGTFAVQGDWSNAASGCVIGYP
jgi:serine protease